MGKQHRGKVPVQETVMNKVMDRQPLDKLGDAYLKSLPSKKVMEYAKMQGMAEVWNIIMTKAVLKDREGNEVSPYEFKDKEQYYIYRQNSDTNIGWVMNDGRGRIDNKYIDVYEAMKTDPDRSYVSHEFDDNVMLDTAAYKADNIQLGGMATDGDDNDFDGDFDGDSIEF